ncbi:hypothetical protein FT641_19015 [Bacillus paranthracis]|uniref:hypothetical protein n=1 Tax=Bacillus paranthracis TaxID=2026186 RepID=UPI0018798072|nr:hypothetical protein [Bacillus paranthracis]MBE7114343.1 hypothetical protein [Bacillus paranthracis]MBE7154784.1 hypothetical protein [Bacillus paranthracis]
MLNRDSVDMSNLVVPKLGGMGMGKSFLMPDLSFLEIRVMSAYNEHMLGIRRKRNWFVCTKEDGVIASGDSLQEVVKKCGASSVKVLGSGYCEFQIKDEWWKRTAWAYRGQSLMNKDGYAVDDVRNSWSMDLN